MPTFTRVTQRVEGFVEFVDDLADTDALAPLDWSRGVFKPVTIRVVYRHMAGDDERWRAHAIVYGIRVRKDGSLGAHDASTDFTLNTAHIPAWVRDHILANHPPTSGVVALEEWAAQRDPQRMGKEVST